MYFSGVCRKLTDNFMGSLFRSLPSLWSLWYFLPVTILWVSWTESWAFIYHGLPHTSLGKIEKEKETIGIYYTLLGPQILGSNWNIPLHFRHLLASVSATVNAATHMGLSCHWRVKRWRKKHPRYLFHSLWELGSPFPILVDRTRGLLQELFLSVPMVTFGIWAALNPDWGILRGKLVNSLSLH